MRAVLSRRLALPLAFLVAAGGAAVAGPRVHDPVGPPYQRLIERVAKRHKLDPALLEALVEAESARNADAVSHAGALGLAQLMPATAERFGVQDPTDPAENLDGAARYLSFLLERFDQRVDLAVAAYNAGEGAVDRHGGIPPYPETRRFVRRVLRGAGMEALADQSGQKRKRPKPARLVKTRDGRLVLTNQ